MKNGSEALSEQIYQFALRVMRLVDALHKHGPSSLVAGGQLGRSGPSVSSNYEEARGAVSHAEFVAKIAISYKECRESVFWLGLIKDVELLPASRMTSLLEESNSSR